MTTLHPDEFDDWLSQLLATTEADAAPPDREFLAGLRERSAAEFSVHSRDQWSPSGSAEASPSQFALRTLVALAATAAVVMAGFFLSRIQLGKSAPVAELTLGEAFDNLTQAESYQAQWVLSDKTFDVWGRGGEGLRLQTPTSTQYSVAVGDTFWDIDETENRATPAPSRYFSTALNAVDPFKLMEMPTAMVAAEKPMTKRVEDGREVYVYLCTLPLTGRPRYEATVDVVTKMPSAIRSLDERGRPYPDLELRFVSFNQPLDPAKLKVAATLTEDGRIGKVTDWQGNVALRPMTSTRWTPICDKPVLRMGDWLRTDFQGANAVTLQLAPQTKLILGPGSLVELTKPDQITLHSGIAEITASPKADNFSGIVKLTGPAGATMDVAGVKLVRTNDKRLATNDKDPPWLAGYKGNAVVETLGSLVATIDGRRVPLTVGYHKVSVEIRDQIARTTIEESFVNHTDSVLEGQFHFPLPADASISGFGMWIGSRLVEADIVEKQRAREIYETILREKRDPGLLEWTGGNIFKARVYPIPGNSEKRIKIVYTQVLPRKGDSYRYSYALQSDLLRTNPLRQLDLDVTVSSTQPLAAVTCPTHLTRNQLTEHAARVEFSTQNYTPTRDFEVVVQTAGNTPDVVFIPHHRGEDGYFLLQLQPPAGEGAWQRDVLPDGEPLNLLVLADTSASMDTSSRKTQGEVLAALLGSLSPNDTFNLAVCDVDCTWKFDQPKTADEKTIGAAREFLVKRRSLGWTNLDRAFESVAKMVQQGTQVVYLGDGIATTGDMDGPAFVQRLTRLIGGSGATMHAVAVSSSYDAAVLRGIASIGGGSLRQVSGEIGPQQTAKDLLAEITRPALRNIQLEFKGLRTARVYPRVLPNVPAGTQQIVLGRFQPQANDQQGEAIITGTLDGKPVTYRTTISVPRLPTPDHRLPNSTDDASFIPRLWARMHLDELLAQGTSQEIQDEIINLSEEFHIITPYTSLLVLETDADRERFKVKRRFQMRDGERFFADARDVAQYQLVQQQMQRAGLWRRGLREQVLSSLASLGRDREQIEAVQPIYSVGDLVVPISRAELINETFAYHGRNVRESSGGIGGAGGDAGRININLFDAEQLGIDLQLGDRLMQITAGPSINAPEPAMPPLAAAPVYDPKPSAPREAMSKMRPGLLAADEPYDGSQIADAKGFGFNGDTRRYKGRIGHDYDGADFRNMFLAMDSAPDAPSRGWGDFAGERMQMAARSGWQSYGGLSFGVNGGRVDWEESAAQASTLWSPLIPLDLPPAPPSPRKPVDRKSLWPEEAQQLSRSLKQAVDLAKLTGGLVVEEQTDTLEAHRGRLAGRTRTTRLASAKAWLVRQESDGYDPQIHWADGAERGVFSPAYELALVRKSAPTDLPKEYQANQAWQTEVEWIFQDHTVELQRPQEGQVLVVLKHAIFPYREARILIDTARHVALSAEWFDRGKRQSSQRASDFVEISGVWLPQKIEQLDDQGRLTNVTTRTFEVVAQDRFDTLVKESLAPRAAALTLALPLPTLAAAKDRIAKGQATLEDRLVLLQDLAADQKWPEATEELTRCEKLVGEKSFAVWMRAWLLQASRQNEELRQLLLRQAQALADKPRTGERTLLDRLTRTASDAFSYEEQLALLGILKPVFARLPEHVQGPNLWGEMRQGLLQSSNRDQEQLVLLRELVRDYPNIDYNHRILARRLTDQGENAAAYEVLKAALARPGANWSPRERDLLYEAWADQLKHQGRYSEQAALVEEWLKLNPEDSDVYERYLAALIYTRREAQADELTGQWLKEGLSAAPLPKEVAARVEAAVETATGDNSHLSSGDVDPRWLRLLGELLVAHAADEDESRFMGEISSDYDVRRTDEYRAAANKIFARLKAEAQALPPAQLRALVDWCNSYVENSEDDDWKAIAAAIRPRWEAATHPAIRELLAELLLKAAGQFSHDERVAFLRLQLEQSDDVHRAAHARALFEALLEAPWSAEIEAESLALIDKLSANDEEAAKLRDQIVALYRWTDRMEEARYEKLNSEIERPDKLTRAELVDKQKELRAKVRGDLATRLKAAAAARQGGLKKWLQIEQLTLEARLERELPNIVENCWELLGPVPPAAQPAVIDEEQSVADQLEAAFRARVAAMLMRLAIRKEAPASESERLINYLDLGIAADIAGSGSTLDARMAKYVLLVALDKPKELAEQLAIWSKGDDRPQFWQRTLAYLKAELGELEAAVALIEPLAADDALDAANYRAIAGWYQALKRDEKYRAAQVAAWKQMDEWRLRDVVQAHLSPWENTGGPTPGTIDPQVFLVLKALLEKSSNPTQHVYYVRSFYEKSRDFRLIAALGDAVVGQSAGNIYRFLKELDSTFEEIDREATVDELLAHVAKVRERAKSLVDQRALDLLTMLAEQRAAEVKNQPSPHVAAAVAALSRANKGNWSPGEPRLFAQLLADLGQITQTPLSDERIRVLKELHAAAFGQPQDRLMVAHALAESLIDDGHRQEAIDVLEPALAEHRTAYAGKTTWSALDSLRRYGDQLSASRNFIRAEQMYRSELARAANESVAVEIRSSIFRLHISALEEGGRTSLGEGLALYRAAQDELIVELFRTDGHTERYRLVERLCELYQTAHRREVAAPAVKADVVAFGEKHLPTLLDRQIDNHQDMVEKVERTIRETAGYLPALTFLVTRLESEPAWLARRGDDGWRHFAWEFGILHDEVRGKLGSLEPRFLKIVLSALRRDLTTQAERRRVIYHDGSTHFWKEKTDDFVRVAEEVLAERLDSPRAVIYIAEYLYDGIDQHNRAIEILLDAHRRNLLDDDGLARLVNWLQQQGRFGESIAFLEPLTQKHPAQLGYRLQLMHAYFQTEQPAALRKLLAETDKFFHEEDRWEEEKAAALAWSCLENELLEEAVEYFKEAIKRRETALGGQTTGDRTLAQYYIDRAYAYGGLKNTTSAVEDACSAAVVWGIAGDGLSRRNARTQWQESGQVHSLDVLRDVLTDSPDLDAYVADLDKQVAQSHEDHPIVRKVLGEVYLERKAFGKALVQLKSAVELAPTDGALHAKLVECYDALMQPQEAAQQLFASVELAPRDINLWVKLSERLEKLEQPIEAERARTSLVEMLPSETEGHAKLAEIRQQQDRWDDAMEHWRQIARIRKFEPAGLLGLAAAQIHQKQRNDAETTLKELETTDWPVRFHDELRQKQLPKLREEWSRLTSPN